MISVIIPTILKIDRIYQTLKELSECEEVGEIILVDNTSNNIPVNLPKLKYICEGKNTYINPAWNKGAELATFDKLCFMNDDIWFDWSYLKKISPFITEDVGMIGMGPACYTEDAGEFGVSKIDPHFTDNLVHRTDGYGCCFFIHKNNYTIIPNELKIWCGDDWLFYQDRNSNRIIEGVKCDGFMSATSDNLDLKSHFDEITNNDILIMRNLIKNGYIVDYFAGSWWGQTK